MVPCGVCAYENPAGARFCNQCGASLQDQPHPREERKVVSVLFVDLVGYTSRTERLDPEDVSAMLRPYHARLREEIERFGGTVEKFIGDAVMAVFGAPTAHEDDAERAVRAALSVLEAIEDLNASRPDLGLKVRAGVNTGEAVVTVGARPEAGEGIATGDVVNTAARLQEAADIGTVLVGELTYRATRLGVDYEQLEPVSLKGKAEPVPVWRARAARQPIGSERPATPSVPFVNRQNELALLTETLARTLRDSAVQLITVLGEPGIGKTRLLLEFRGVIDAEGDVVSWRRGHCLPYGDGITFWALGEIVKAEAGIFESDGPDDAFAKLAAVLNRLSDDATEREWLAGRLAPLIGLTGPTERPDREELFAALHRFLEALAAERPLVLVFEDLHWADRALLEFLERVVDWSSGVPILLICTARPELFELSPGWGGGKRNSTTIGLAPLSNNDTEQLVSALLDEAPLPPNTRVHLLDRCGGNPLYAVEFAHMFGERGLAEEAAIPVPETVQAVIAARLDTLPQARKALVQDAAVLGTSFWSSALAAMAGADEQTVRADLQELARKELIRRARSTSVEGQEEYAFWHGVVRDVVYAQIPRSLRARKHRLAAEWIEGLAPERIADHAELLAHHYCEALSLVRASGADAETAVLHAAASRFLLLAGDRAMRLDRGTAESFYRRALALAPPGSPYRAGVLARMADAHFWAGRSAEADRAYTEAIEEFKARGDFRSAGEAIASASFAAAQLSTAPGDILRARELLSEAIRLLESGPPSRELAFGYGAAARNEILAGRIRMGMELATKAIELADRLGIHSQAVRARQFRGFAKLSLGDAAGADEIREALRLSLERGLGFESVTAYQNLAHATWYMEGPLQALELGKTGIELGERRGLARQMPWGEVELIKFLYDLGSWDSIVATTSDLIAQERGEGLTLAASWEIPYLAYVVFFRGDADAAARLIDDILARARTAIGWQSLVPGLALSALIHARAGDAPTTVERVQELIGITEENPVAAAQHLPDAVRACCAVRALETAEAVMRGADRQLRRSQYSVLSASAVLAEARGEIAEAAGLYAEAARCWADFGSALECGQASLGRGRCLVVLDSASDATRSLENAERVFRALGATPLVEQTAALSEQASLLKA
jgi:predicted ATPase/class 3 adenylate cyclase